MKIKSAAGEIFFFKNVQNGIKLIKFCIKNESLRTGGSCGSRYGEPNRHEPNRV